MDLLRLIYTDYDIQNGKLIVRATGRDEYGEYRTLRIREKLPYLFVPEDEPIPSDISQLVKKVGKGYQSFDNKPVKKLLLNHPQDTNDVESFFSKPYESDIPYYRRCALDGLNGYVKIPEGKNSVHIDEIETNVEPDEPINPKIAIADIEVKVGDDGIEEMKKKANMPILCISLWDSYTNSYYQFVLDDDNLVDGRKVREYLRSHWNSDYPEYSEANVELVRCSTEKDMLNSFISQIREIQPDLISGWNFVTFDWVYLLSRMVNLDGVNPHRLSDIGGMSHRQLNSERSDVVARCVDGLPAFDMMEGYLILIFKEIRSKALDYVADKDLGIGKVEGIDINKAYEEDRSRLVAYNLIDSQLCVALDEANDIFGFFFELSEICNIPIWDTVVPMRRVDGYILSRRGDDEILPSAEEKDLPRISGALVFKPSTGVKDWVGVHDLASLYPSSIITWNISPETVTNNLEDADLIIPNIPDPDNIQEGITGDDIKWDGNGAIGTSLDEQGIIPKYLNKLFPLRDEKKELRDQYPPDDLKYKMYNNQQYSAKVLMNCFDSDTSIVTEEGIKSINEVERGELVYSIDPETKEVSLKEVIDTQKYPHSGDMINIENQFISFSVTPNHKMLVNEHFSWGNRFDDTKFVKAGDLKKKRYQIPNGSSISGDIPEEFDLFNELKRYSSEVVIKPTYHGHLFRKKMEEFDIEIKRRQENGRYIIDSDEFNEELEDDFFFRKSRRSRGQTPSSVDMEKWLEFLGWYISEGCVVDYEKYGADSKAVYITQYDEDTRKEIFELVDDLGFKPRMNKNDVIFSNSVIGEWLIDNCGKNALGKKLPEFIYSLDSSLLEHLWNSLRRGDGNSRVPHYYTSSKKLKDDMVKLGIHLGYKPRVAIQDSQRKNVGYVIQYSNNKGSFNQRHLSTETNEDGNVYCVTVSDNHTVIAGKNGKYQWIGQSTFGVLANKYWRLSGKDLGDAVTGGSRYVIWKATQYIEESGYDILFGDTDSIGVSLGKEEDEKDVVMDRGFSLEGSLNHEMDKLANEIGIEDSHPYIEKAHHGTDNLHLFEFEYEKLYRKFLQAGKKKRYAGNVTWKEGKDVDEIDITGFEFQRSDVPEISAIAQQELIEGVLRGESFEEISDSIRRLVDRMNNDFSVREYGIPAALNQPVESYPNWPRKRGSLYSNEYLGYDWRKGSSPWLIYVSESPPGLPTTDVIAIDWSDELPDGFEVDYSKMEEKCFGQPLDKVLNLLGWDWNEVKTGKQTRGIGDW